MNNSEILFCYDAILTNPNGDPDDENKPRMDYERNRNLVSDVRLKRYIRDYLEAKGNSIYVSKVDGKTVTATERLQRLGNIKDDTFFDLVLDELIDIRLFGATMPIKGQDKEGGRSVQYTGPVQFNWGYSLNPVSLVDSNAITSHFGSEANKEQGTMGNDYRVYYSLIAFHGVISGLRAKHTKTTSEDIVLMEEAILKAIPLSATRSKIGQYPRLYLRMEYVDDRTIIGDLRPLISIKPQTETLRLEDIRQVQELVLDFSRATALIKEKADIIDTIYYWQDPQLVVEVNDQKGLLGKCLPDKLKSKVKTVSY